MTTESAVMLVPPSADRRTLSSRPRPSRECGAPGGPAGPQPGPVARTRLPPLRGRTRRRVAGRGRVRRGGRLAGAARRLGGGGRLAGAGGRLAGGRRKRGSGGAGRGRRRGRSAGRGGGP